ncbi:hypothetical protein KUTeg_005783 [Tegillarca granosa]|uniref:Uncharacterized protein n=1 Tax=Tegillarca granosa TaxID=220873 RepID=A0ABQ9FHA7_TEGGR|nr:hypothetical protein KUTeg_005783 [Tegillarca granosa]
MSAEYSISIIRMSWYENPIGFVLFSLECYHIMGHLNVLFRVRLLPRKDLKRLRLYFLVDLLTVFSSSILFLQKLQWLAVLQMLQHAYYVVFWDQTYMTKKIISWSSIDWIKSERHKEWHWDSILGTGFDIVVHFCMAFLLGPYLSTVQIVIALAIAQFALFSVLLSSKFAWSNPFSPPKWVEKRVQKIED